MAMQILKYGKVCDFVGCNIPLTTTFGEELVANRDDGYFCWRHGPCTLCQSKTSGWVVDSFIGRALLPQDIDLIDVRWYECRGVYSRLQKNVSWYKFCDQCFYGTILARKVKVHHFKCCVSSCQRQATRLKIIILGVNTASHQKYCDDHYYEGENSKRVDCAWDSRGQATEYICFEMDDDIYYHVLQSSIAFCFEPTRNPHTECILKTCKEEMKSDEDGAPLNMVLKRYLKLLSPILEGGLFVNKDIRNNLVFNINTLKSADAKYDVKKLTFNDLLKFHDEINFLNISIDDFMTIIPVEELGFRRDDTVIPRRNNGDGSEPQNRLTHYIPTPVIDCVKFSTEEEMDDVMLDELNYKMELKLFYAKEASKTFNLEEGIECAVVRKRVYLSDRWDHITNKTSLGEVTQDDIDVIVDVAAANDDNKKGIGEQLKKALFLWMARNDLTIYVRIAIESEFNNGMMVKFYHVQLERLLHILPMKNILNKTLSIKDMIEQRYFCYMSSSGHPKVTAKCNVKLCQYLNDVFMIVDKSTKCNDVAAILNGKRKSTDGMKSGDYGKRQRINDDDDFNLSQVVEEVWGNGQASGNEEEDDVILINT